MYCLEIRGLSCHSILHFAKLVIGDAGGKSRQHRLYRKRSEHVTVVVVLPHDHKKVPDAPTQAPEGLLQIRTRKCKTVDHAPLEGSVVSHDGFASVEVAHKLFRARPRRVLAAQVEKLPMLEPPFPAHDVAGPLERDLLVRPRARPYRHREGNRLEVEVRTGEPPCLDSLGSRPRVPENLSLGRSKMDTVQALVLELPKWNLCQIRKSLRPERLGGFPASTSGQEIDRIFRRPWRFAGAVRRERTRERVLAVGPHLASGFFARKGLSRSIGPGRHLGDALSQLAADGAIH